MDALKAKKHATTALTLKILLTFVGIVGIFSYIVYFYQSTMSNGTEITQQQAEQLVMGMILPIVLYIAITSILGIVSLVFYILAMVYAANFENKVPLILLAVGFLVTFVDIVGLIFTIIEANKELNKPSEPSAEYQY